MDLNGDVRIGDFGLAVNQGLADPADVFLSLDASLEEVDLTSGELIELSLLLQYLTSAALSQQELVLRFILLPKLYLKAELIDMLNIRTRSIVS